MSFLFSASYLRDIAANVLVVDIAERREWEKENVHYLLNVYYSVSVFLLSIFSQISEVMHLGVGGSVSPLSIPQLPLTYNFLTRA